MSDQTKAIIATFVKTFIVALLAQFIAIGGDIWSIDKQGWKSILSSGVAALVMFAYNYFSTSFALYGKGASVTSTATDTPPAA